MTPAEFREALKTLGMSQRFFAANSRTAISTVNRWAQGTQPIPGWVEWIIDLLKKRTPTE